MIEPLDPMNPRAKLETEDDYRTLYWNKINELIATYNQLEQEFKDHTHNQTGMIDEETDPPTLYEPEEPDRHD